MGGPDGSFVLYLVVLAHAATAICKRFGLEQDCLGTRTGRVIKKERTEGAYEK
jgi:hypothetical protein